jgi:tRNA threonylcarbamoyladenosine biosynthesis protein TsaB
MSLILHLETATTVCSVALSYDGKLIALKEENKGFTHAEHLTVFIEEVMQKSNQAFSNLDAIAVSKGPGSYTGLRIGVATAKGLCFGLGKPLLAINTLSSMAFGASLKHSQLKYFCPMLDARRMEVYTALYHQNLEEISPTEALILNDSSFNEKLLENEVLFFGDGAPKFQEICNHRHAKFDLELQPSAANMVGLAYNKYQQQLFEDLAYFEPFYLKEFYSPTSSTKN